MTALAAILLAFAWQAPAQSPDGAAIYKKQCASCHGDAGQGVKGEYAEPLVGDRSVASLTKYVEKWMPELEPQECVGEDAAAVARYIHEEFYSPAAQARLNPPDVALSRLTATQHRNVIADLIASFRDGGEWGDDRGLKAEFFNDGRRLRRRVGERIDAKIDFDFGDKAPAEKVDKDKFGIRWSGGILAEQTGEYEFIADSANGIRLWVNDREKPVIDALVRSGNLEEVRGKVFLLGGRVYPFRLEFFRLEKDKTASVTLKWKPPHRAERVVPAEAFSPDEFPRVLVVSTPFPPDDRSMGYERGTLVSKAWHEATTYAALETADYVAMHWRRLAENLPDPAHDEEGEKPSDKSAGGDEQMQLLRDFCTRFAERALRRPLTPQQQRFFIDQHFEGAGDDDEARELIIKKVVLQVLASPRFLFHELGSPSPDAYDVAARMSFGLWDSLPDEPLRRAAAEGGLDTPDRVRQQLERMMQDRRTKVKVRQFFRDWLGIEQLHELAKNEERFPQFDETLVADLRQSLDLFIDDVVWSESSDFRRLMRADDYPMNSRLAKFYGVEAEAQSDDGFVTVSLEPEHRAGVLTHPLLMAGYAYDATSSPIHRGVFVIRSLLGRRLRPPKDAATPVPPELHPDLTTRQRIALQTQPRACMTCHDMINPAGFPMEQFDAVGRLRHEENGKPVDASGHLETRGGETVQFSGAAELADFLADSDEAHDAFIERLFQHVTKQPILAYGNDLPGRLRQSFHADHYNIRALLVDLVTAASLHERPKSKGNDS